MGILYVNWNRMDQAACGAKQVSRRLQETSEEILFVKNSLKFSGAYSDTLDSRLKQLSHGIAAQSRAAKGVGTLLTKAAKRYRSCENAIAQDSMLGSGKKSIKEVFGDKVIPIPRAFEMTDSGRMYLEFFKKFLGQFGAAGKIDVGTDAAIGAGLTALLTFFGITSAPAVAVGGGVIAVKWSLDSSFEYLFGSDFSETISDGILDMGEYIWDSASQKWDEFSDYVSDAWDGITDAASDAVDYAFDFADDVKDSIGEAANNVKDGVHSAWNDFSNWVFG